MPRKRMDPSRYQHLVPIKKDTTAPSRNGTGASPTPVFDIEASSPQEQNGLPTPVYNPGDTSPQVQNGLPTPVYNPGDTSPHVQNAVVPVRHETRTAPRHQPRLYSGAIPKRFPVPFRFPLLRTPQVGSP